MPGTGEERESVASDVASDLDDMDVDQLRTALAESRDRQRELESNIGRQNNVQGERINRLEKDFGSKIDRLIQEKAEAEERAKRAYYGSLSPSEKTAAQLRELQQKVEAQERRQAYESQAKQQEQQIDLIVEEARKKGYDTSRISRTDVQEALGDLGALDHEAVRTELAAIKKQMKDQEEGIVETVAAASGRRMVSTGSPASVKQDNKISPEERQYREELEQARTKKGRSAAESVLAVKIRAQKEAGIIL